MNPEMARLRVIAVYKGVGSIPEEVLRKIRSDDDLELLKADSRIMLVEGPLERLRSVVGESPDWVLKPEEEFSSPLPEPSAQRAFSSGDRHKVRLSRGALLLLLVVSSGATALGLWQWFARGPEHVIVVNPDTIAQDRGAVATNNVDPFRERARAVSYLDQNWSPEESVRFYFTSVGSRVLPYDWFLALEQADNNRSFREETNILKFRYLPQRPDATNPDGLPVGFVKNGEPSRVWLGFNCAACHTSEVHYGGVAYRIDGGAGLGDFSGLMQSLTNALTATRDRSDKFERFAEKILGEKTADADTRAKSRETLRLQLVVVIERLSGYNARNFPPGHLAGFGRVDSLGAMLNEVYHHAVPANSQTSFTINTREANAPTSIPFLWDTPQHDRVFWNGSSSNVGSAGIDGLGRNVGKMLGVLIDFEIDESTSSIGYRSSVRIEKLRTLEDAVRTLRSPRWPEAFPPIDADLRDKGRALYQERCIQCHPVIDPDDPDRKVIAHMDDVGTDPLCDSNFRNRDGNAGKLKGRWSKYIVGLGETIPAVAPANMMLENVVIGVIIGSAFAPPADVLSKNGVAFPMEQTSPSRPERNSPGQPGLQYSKYKARPLNGIWATAPYLHNGSVPSLYDLLKPVKERPRSFSVGSREFDPGRVGFKQDAPGLFVFRVVDANGKTIPGNSNAGHEFGTSLPEDARVQLLEYLKSL
jgi:hypothetical protein